VSILAPQVLDDSNSFLKGFVNHELLAFLGVIVTITLASVANLHLELNKIEESLQRGGAFTRTRFKLRQSAHWLLALLLIALSIVTAKPVVIAAYNGGTAAALFNSAALLVVLFNVLVLLDLTSAAFQISPQIQGNHVDASPRSSREKRSEKEDSDDNGRIRSKEHRPIRR
jgi:hypothetical protein